MHNWKTAVFTPSATPPFHHILGDWHKPSVFKISVYLDIDLHSINITVISTILLQLVAITIINNLILCVKVASPISLLTF